MVGKIPVTVLTGFLGAGKTTLLNRILTAAHGRKLAVVVNEFGEIGIDNDLIVAADEEIYELSNGCVCCSIRGDLVRVIGGLLRRAGNLDGILVETTGLADPAPVAQTFLTDQEIAARAALDSVIALVDARHISGQLKENPEVERQIAFADALVLNKADLVEPTEMAAIQALLRRINPFASIHVATRGEVPLDQILARGSFSFEAVALRLAAMDEEREPETDPKDAHTQDCGCGCCMAAAPAPVLAHNSEITSVSLVTEQPLDGQKIQNWIGELAAQKGAELLRYKGIFNVEGEENRIVIQGVQMMLEGGALSPWPEGARRVSRLVLIGRKLDEKALRDSFLACVK